MSAHKFKVGDKVRIVRQVDAEAGWKNSWVDDMTRRVNDGGVYTVESIGDAGQGFRLSCGYGWPASALELAKPEPKVEYTVRQVGADWAMVNYFSERDAAVEYIRTKCAEGKAYELLEVRAVALVTPKRIVEVDE